MISANSVAVEFTGAPAGFLELSTSWQLLHTVPAGTGFVDFVTLRWDERSQALVELRVTDAGGAVVALMRNQQRYMPPVVSVLPTYKVYVRAPGAQLGQTRFSIYLFGHVERSLTATAVLGVGTVTVNGDSPALSVASGASQDIAIHDTAGADVGSRSDATVTVADGSVSVNGSGSIPVKAEGSANIDVEDTAGADVGTLAGTTVTVADTTVTVNSSAYGTTEAESTLNVEVVDDGDNPVGSLSGGKWVVPAGSGSGPVGAKLMKTGQTTSFATGDDGDVQAGRAVDLFTLDENNPFGNTARFTGTTGGYAADPENSSVPDYRDASGVATTQALAFPNDIAIDWSTYDGSTALGVWWSRYFSRNGSYADWATVIADASASSVGGFSSGWRVPNIRELLNLASFNATRTFNYAPFFDTSNARYWSSTRNPNYIGSTAAFVLLAQYQMFPIGVTLTYDAVYVRDFTVTGTTLT